MRMVVSCDRDGASPSSVRRLRHLLGIEGLLPGEINQFLDLAEGYVELNRQADNKRSLLRRNPIHRDVPVVRHPESGAVHLLSERVDYAVGCASAGRRGRSESQNAVYDSKRTASPRASISFTAVLSKEAKISAPSQLPS
jgi:hypothetical protein